jgi:hypothetical protein
MTLLQIATQIKLAIAANRNKQGVIADCLATLMGYQSHHQVGDKHVTLSAKIDANTKPTNQDIRTLFDSADSLSIGDEFIRYNNPSTDDEFELYLTSDDDRYEFTTHALDSATFDDDEWSIFCEYNQQYVDVRFYTVKQMI